MGEHPLERTRHASRVERVHEQRSVLDLPPTRRAQEAPQLGIERPFPLRGLLLKRAERSQLALLGDDALDDVWAECANELVLQVRLAHVEAKPLHTFPGETGAETGPLERAADVGLLAGVAEPCEPEIETVWAEPLE